MSLPVPPKYIVVPLLIIEQAYQPDKPRRALFASFVRILSLAWENKYERTPLLNEQELWEYLKLSRRQYFDQKADMELLGWLRSSHPVTGFVQFSFSRMVAVEPVTEVSAENFTVSAEKRTVLRRIEEEDSTEILNTKSSSSSSLKQDEVRKTAPVQEIALIQGNRKLIVVDDEQTRTMKCLVENLHLAFDPEIFSVLEWRDDFLAGIPERVKGWIAKAYQDRENLTRGGGALGLIVRHILQQDAPHRYFVENFRKILPVEYLEAIGELDIECVYCTDHFSTRAARDEHQRSAHANHCDECGADFATADLLKTHFKEEHDPYRVQKTAPAFTPNLETNDEAGKLWQTILGLLAQEMPRASFDTWVRDTEPVRYDGNTLVIGTRNAYARDWMENRMTETVERILIRVENKKVNVSFVVPEKA